MNDMTDSNVLAAIRRAWPSIGERDVVPTGVIVPFPAAEAIDSVLGAPSGPYCPVCNAQLRASEGYPGYWFCYSCMENAS